MEEAYLHLADCTIINVMKSGHERIVSVFHDNLMGDCWQMYNIKTVITVY